MRRSDFLPPNEGLPTMRCEDAERIIEQVLAGAPPEDHERQALVGHTLHCPHCGQMVSEVLVADLMLRTFPQQQQEQKQQPSRRETNGRHWGWAWKWVVEEVGGDGDGGVGGGGDDSGAPGDGSLGMARMAGNDDLITDGHGGTN